MRKVEGCKIGQRPLAVDICGPDDRKWSGQPERVPHLFRITQEAVHNAVKHARPEHIVVRLRADPLGLAMYVYDDGRGMVPSNCSPGMGLRIMRYRAAAIGATLTITPNDDGGTLMSCILPRKD